MVSRPLAKDADGATQVGAEALTDSHVHTTNTTLSGRRDSGITLEHTIVRDMRDANSAVLGVTRRILKEPGKVTTPTRRVTIELQMAQSLCTLIVHAIN